LAFVPPLKSVITFPSTFARVVHSAQLARGISKTLFQPYHQVSTDICP
jgi:hypothetical protein